jgi:hypothetical protein
MSKRLRNIDIALQQTTFNANEVRGLLQTYGYPMTAYKATAQTISAATILSNDADLWCELYGAGQHEIEIWLNTPAMTAAGGIKLQLIADQGLTVNAVNLSAYYYLTGVAPAVTPISALSSPVNGGTTNAWTSVLIKGTVDVVNQGVLQLQIAQQAASGTTTVGVGSYLTTILLASTSLVPNQ